MKFTKLTITSLAISVVTFVSHYLFFNQLSEPYKKYIPNDLVMFIIIAIITTSVSLMIYTYQHKLIEITRSKKFYFSLLFLIFVFFSLIGIKKHINIDNYIYDFGVQYQAVVSTSQGRFFEASVEVENFLGDHVSFLLAIPAMVHIFIPSPFIMYFIQSFSIVLGAYGFYLISKKLLKSEHVSRLISLMFIFYIPISYNFLFDFHENSLAIPFLTFGIYYFISEKYKYSYISFALALLAKEDIGFLVGSFGLYHLLVYRNSKALPVFLGGFIYSLVAMFVMIPFFRRGELSDSFQRFSYFGNSGGEVISTIIRDPVDAIRQMLTRNKLFYIFKLFYPVAFLTLFAPFTLIVILPCLVINLIADNGAYNSGLYQYNIMIAIGIFYSAIVALQNLKEEKVVDSIKNKLYFINSNFIIFILVSISTSIFILHPLWKDLMKPLDRFDEYRYIQSIKESIPTDTPIGAANSVGSLFGEYRYLEIVYPQGWGRSVLIPEYIILDKHYGGLNEVNSVVQSYQKVGYVVYGEFKDIIILQNTIEQL